MTFEAATGKKRKTKEKLVPTSAKDIGKLLYTFRLPFENVQFCTFVPFQGEPRSRLSFRSAITGDERRGDSPLFRSQTLTVVGDQGLHCLVAPARLPNTWVGGEGERVATPRSSDDAKKLSNEEEEEVHSKRIFSLSGSQVRNEKKGRERDNNNKGLKGVTPTKTPQQRQTTILLLFRLWIDESRLAGSHSFPDRRRGEGEKRQFARGFCGRVGWGN